MSRTVALLLLLVAVVAINAAPQHGINESCGNNEVFKTCGTDCEPSCQNPNPGACTLRCVIGCQCMEGHVRNAEGHCVQTYNC